MLSPLLGTLSGSGIQPGMINAFLEEDNYAAALVQHVGCAVAALEVAKARVKDQMLPSDRLGGVVRAWFTEVFPKEKIPEGSPRMFFLSTCGRAS